MVLEERAVPDRDVHAHQVLEEDAPGADRQVPDLGVPHLPGRQPDGLARGRELRVREALQERVEDGRVGELDRVSRAAAARAPAVEDDERDEVAHAATSAPARQIASNDAGSSEAPPTSAPSTSGWASSVRAFSGFTEPP